MAHQERLVPETSPEAVAKTLCPQCGGLGLIPAQDTEIPRAMGRDLKVKK